MRNCCCKNSKFLSSLKRTASIKRTIHPTDWNSEMLGNEAFVGTTTKKERKPSRRDRPTDATRTPTENG